MKNEYLLEVRVKNNLLLSKIKGLGYDVISDFTADHDVCKASLYRLLSFDMKPISNNGEYKTITKKLINIFNCEIYDLFTPVQLELERKITKKEIEISEAQLQLISNENDITLIANYALNQDFNELDKFLNLLGGREKEIVEDRFFNDMTLEKVGEKHGITKERVRQITLKSLRKARCMIRRRELVFNIDEDT